MDHPMITLDDHLCNDLQNLVEQPSFQNVKQGDPSKYTENANFLNSELESKINVQTDHLITLDQNPELVCITEGDPSRRSQGDHEAIALTCDRLDDNSRVLHKPTKEPNQKTNTISDKKDFDFWLVSPTILSLHINSRLGDILCTAKPEAPILNEAKNLVGYECSMVWTWPTGGQVKIKVGLTQAGDFEEGANKIAKEWLETHQPWKPRMYKDAMYGGVLVKIVGGGHGKWQIEYSDGTFLHVKANKLSKPD